MHESLKPTEEEEDLPAYYFDTFVEWAPDADRRHLFAIQAADPEYLNQDRINMPTHHQGYNLLLANWNSPEHRLWHTYQQFYELSYSVASAKRGEPVIVGEPMALSDMESIHDWPEYEAMQGPAKFQAGYLASSALDFQYRSKLHRGGNGVHNVKPPYLLAAARLQLVNVQEYCFDIGTLQYGPRLEESKVRAITLASTLDGDETTYRQQHFAQANPVIIGNEECNDFIAALKDQYMIGE